MTLLRTHMPRQSAYAGHEMAFEHDRMETVVKNVLSKLADTHPATRSMVIAMASERLGNRYYVGKEGRERMKTLETEFGVSTGIHSTEGVQLAIESISALVELELNIQ